MASEENDVFDRVSFDLEGKIRGMRPSDDYLNKINRIAKESGKDIGVRITSGGQPSKGSGGKRTGSTRHDIDEHGHVGTSDFVLTRNGKDVRPGDDPDLYASFLNRAASQFPGIGHYDWGVHVGGGSVAAWGPDTTASTLDPVFAEAIEAGRKGAAFDMNAAPVKTDVSPLGGNNLDFEPVLKEDSGTTSEPAEDGGFGQIIKGLALSMGESAKEREKETGGASTSMLSNERGRSTGTSPSASQIESMIAGFGG